MSAEPSPRPWQVIKMIGLDEDDVTVFVADAHNSSIARMGAYSENDEANAALIVDAVSERDRLRDLVRRTVETLEQVYKHADMTDYLRADVVEMQREARAAIGEDAPYAPCAHAPSVVSSSMNNEKP